MDPPRIDHSLYNRQLLMEWIEFAIDLVQYEPPISGQPLNLLYIADSQEATPLFAASDAIVAAMIYYGLARPFPLRRRGTILKVGFGARL